MYMGRGGFPMTRKIVCAYALAIARKSGKESHFNSTSGPGMHWWTNFRIRNPKLSLRRADKLDRGRVQNANKQVILEYFELLEKSLIESSIKDKLDRIYNCDKTGLVLELVPMTKSLHLVEQSTYIPSQWEHVSTLQCMPVPAPTGRCCIP